MEIIVPFLVGLLYAAGIFLVLKKSLVKLIIGIVLTGHATNLFLITVSRVSIGIPPFIGKGEIYPRKDFADPLPQALILTAIVIGFGIQAFVIILLKRLYQTAGTSDLDKLNITDKIKEV